MAAYPAGRRATVTLAPNTGSALLVLDHAAGAATFVDQVRLNRIGLLFAAGRIDAAQRAFLRTLTGGRV